MIEIQYPEQLDLTRWVRSGDALVASQIHAEPVTLTRRLIAQRAAIGPVSLFIGPTLADTFAAEHGDFITFRSYCGTARNALLADGGALDPVPSHFSAYPGLFGSRGDALRCRAAGGERGCERPLQPGIRQRLHRCRCAARSHGDRRSDARLALGARSRAARRHPAAGDRARGRSSRPSCPRRARARSRNGPSPGTWQALCRTARRWRWASARCPTSSCRRCGTIAAWASTRAPSVRQSST